MTESDTYEYRAGLWGFAPDEWVGETGAPLDEYEYTIERAEMVGEPGSEKVEVEIKREKKE